MSGSVGLPGVSRETNDRLITYLTLLEKWNGKINLVSPSTIQQAWSRHFLDSAQLLTIPGKLSGTWLDLGSGGGFPGLVVAIILAETDPTAKVILMESDQRKGVFLRSVLRETGVEAVVVTDRIEMAEPVRADIISARALAPLSDLLRFVQRHGSAESIAVFPKGRRWQEEIRQAEKEWRFKHSAHPSNTDPEAVILRIEEIEHV